MIRKNLPASRGFTLIEVLVAAGILAVLAGIAIPAYQSYVRSANATECANEMLLIQLAEEEFFVETNGYFAGGDITTLEGTSNGLYRSSFQGTTAVANANCDFAVVAGATGIGNSYALTATGKNQLDASDNMSFTK